MQGDSTADALLLKLELLLQLRVRTMRQLEQLTCAATDAVSVENDLLEQEQQNQLGHKTCKHCKQVKSLSDFKRRRVAKDGFGRICKDCLVDYSRQGKELDTPPAFATCAMCQLTKPSADFSRMKRSKTKLQAYCRACCQKDAAQRKAELEGNHDTPATKACTKCGITKAATEFSRSQSNKDGLQTRCKQCQQEARSGLHAWINVESKQCGTCGIQKPAFEFYRSWKLPDGRHNVCKNCTVQYKEQRQREREAQLLTFGFPVTAKVCKGCGEALPVDAFYVDVQCKHFLKPRCKACYSLSKRTSPSN